MDILNYESIDTPFVCEAITGDGNCVFRSLSQLVYGNQDNHLRVRNDVVDHILANWTQYKNYFVYNGNSVIDENAFKRQYRENMTTPGVFATSVEIMAAANLYKIYIVVFKDNRVNMTLGNRLNPVKYLRFTGDLESGHVDVYKPVINIESTKSNSTRIKYNYVQILLNRLRAVTNFNDAENEKLTNVEDQIKKTYNSSDKNFVKDDVYTNAINILQNMYNNYYSNTPLPDTLTDQFDTTDNFAIDSLMFSSEGNNKNTINFDNTKLEETASISSLPSTVVLSVDQTNANRDVQTPPIVVEETSNYKPFTNLTTLSILPVSLARIYLNVRPQTVEDMIVSVNVLNDLTISSTTKTALSNFVNDINFEKETILYLDVEDVFHVNLLRDFISKYGNVSRYINLTGAVGNVFNEKITTLFNAGDILAIIDSQPTSVAQALRQLRNKLNDMLPYDLLLRIYEEDYYFLDNQMVKSVLDAYNKIVPIQLQNKNVAIASKEPLASSSPLAQPSFSKLSNTIADLIDTPNEFSDANVQDYFEDEIFDENTIQTDEETNRRLTNVTKHTMLDRVRSKQQKRKKQRTLVPTKFVDRQPQSEQFVNDNRFDRTFNTNANVSTVRPLSVPAPESMPVYFAKIIANISPILENTLLTCPTDNLNSYPKYCNFARSLNIIRAMNLTALCSNKIYFFEMLKPLAYYGDNELYETKMIYFIFEAYLYYKMCAANYYSICEHFAQDDNRDRICLFMINYNFLWHYRQFISKLPASALTAFQNRKILNNIHIYTTRVQSEFDKLPLKFPALDGGQMSTPSAVVQLMLGSD
ncbi:vp80 [Hyposidra talaca nucleopolyhedrovirus]|uniref:Vp80 n=1 Tax=Hyposidra talaca nucleopolyhedrovirus TaxID=1070315 RepID=A0A2Z4HI39_9ABAC|nr:vp80 [Hyposidra talaca nucleopolyhedrovirus]AWW14449.1 vp80 [Hyposidra talaca nucleopolyhedrovirus]